ncbi:MAG: hypothetical protein M1274_15365 [Actinobacteria bacterium]|nr:hypothetical protein [Actinomycetota bacterium]
MTLVVAMACADGVVIAADSAASEADVGTKIPVGKIKQVLGQPILFGGSGDVGVLQKYERSLDSLKPKNHFDATVQLVKSRLCQILREGAENHAPHPEPPFNRPPFGVLLLAAVWEGKPWVVEFERDGRDQIYDMRFGRFAAIGSGKVFAHAIARPYLYYEPRTLAAGQCICYRVMQDAIALAASGLAEPIDMSWINLDGAVTQLGATERAAIRQTCDLWREMEREALGSALAPGVIGSGDETQPIPQAAEECRSAEEDM